MESRHSFYCPPLGWLRKSNRSFFILRLQRVRRMINMNLMKLEMMNGTERLAEALQMRGLFLLVKNDVIELTAENTKEDIEKVQELLNNLNIPTL